MCQELQTDVVRDKPVATTWCRACDDTRNAHDATHKNLLRIIISQRHRELIRLVYASKQSAQVSFVQLHVTTCLFLAPHDALFADCNFCSASHTSNATTLMSFLACIHPVNTHIQAHTHTQKTTWTWTAQSDKEVLGNKLVFWDIIAADQTLYCCRCHRLSQVSQQPQQPQQFFFTSNSSSMTSAHS